MLSLTDYVNKENSNYIIVQLFFKIKIVFFIFPHNRFPVTILSFKYFLSKVKSDKQSIPNLIFTWSFFMNYNTINY